MQKVVTCAGGTKFTLSDKDIVNLDDYDFFYRSTGSERGLYVFLDHGYVQAAAFALCLQDALDEVVDSGKLKAYRITEEDQADYEEDDTNITYLGNCCVPHDIESLDVSVIPFPEFTFVGMLP